MPSQSALLYTTSNGERRIRVHTLAIPVSSIVEEIVKSVDIDTLCNIMARQALDTALKAGLEPARQRLFTTCVDVLRGAKPNSHLGALHTGPPGSVYGGPQAASAGVHDAPSYPETLKLLPLYTMALQKSVVFRGGADMGPDERSDFMQKLNVMGVSSSRFFIYPRMFSLHNLSNDACQPTSDDDSNAVGVPGKKVTLPEMRGLSGNNLTSDGVYMLENSLDVFVWIGHSTSPSVLQQLFGISSLDQSVDLSNIQLQRCGSDLAIRVDRLLQALMDERCNSMRVFLTREGDPSEAKFYRYLVEDRTGFMTVAYGEFMALVDRQTR